MIESFLRNDMKALKLLLELAANLEHFLELGARNPDKCNIVRQRKSASYNILLSIIRNQTTDVLSDFSRVHIQS